jgi:hypothetical protein
VVAGGNHADGVGGVAWLGDGNFAHVTDGFLGYPESVGEDAEVDEGGLDAVAFFVGRAASRTMAACPVGQGRPRRLRGIRRQGPGPWGNR